MGCIGLRVYYHPHTDLKTQTNPHNIAAQLQECRYGYVLFGVMVSQEKSMCRRRSQNSIQPNWSLSCTLGMKEFWRLAVVALGPFLVCRLTESV